ncbi:hypothetical protein ACSSZE_03370 [Acidithiobacillus caldus]
MPVNKNRIPANAVTVLLLLMLAAVAYYWAVTIHERGNPPIAQEIQKDTHGAVTQTGLFHRHGITVVTLHTPKGPEIAYLIAGKYLAIGPLMDLKTGINVTPLWEKLYAK